ncbi:hypothetical protein PG993_000807 [Apiospora rasikravindrae]|uniref:Uncharacterized protein n=1 Tax=Apiospora rasikravindrae TaxID=990691 RepID=A0ABR1UBV7_9PEZI
MVSPRLALLALLAAVVSAVPGLALPHNQEEGMAMELANSTSFVMPDLNATSSSLDRRDFGPGWGWDADHVCYTKLRGKCKHPDVNPKLVSQSINNFCKALCSAARPRYDREGHMEQVDFIKKRTVVHIRVTHQEGCAWQDFELCRPFTARPYPNERTCKEFLWGSWEGCNGNGGRGGETTLQGCVKLAVHAVPDPAKKRNCKVAPFVS